MLYVVLVVVWLQGQPASGQPVRLGAHHTGSVFIDNQSLPESSRTRRNSKKVTFMF